MAFWNKGLKKRPIIKQPVNTSAPKAQSPLSQQKKKTETSRPASVKSKTDLKEKPYHPEKEFLDTFNKLTQRHRKWDIWQDFIIMSACSISNPLDKIHYEERESRYLQIIKKYSKQDQTYFPELFAHMVMALERNPEQDFLGHIFMRLNLGDDTKCQEFTPYEVCRMMADITVGNAVEQVKKDGYITIHDSCCGAGATLIAGIHATKKQLEKENLNFQNHILVAAQDIDEIVALMCYIQLSLLGVAAYIKIGNSLTEPMSTDDSIDCYWFTPMYFSDVWSTRRIVQKMDDILKGENT